MISAAIVGLGRWGQPLVAALEGKSSRIRFVRGVVRDPARARDFAARYGLALTNALAEAVRDGSIDAVFLATPHSLHVEQVVAVAAAGSAAVARKAAHPRRRRAGLSACPDAGMPPDCGYSRRCFYRCVSSNAS
jgi:3-hydroxyisobutyrate dehydrogenase-like beta-hydroxyacid dehydrogenase